jgi:hypothetical protein
MSGPWEFGWTQLLTIVGLGMTGAISLRGLRTFGKWRRERVEERRIDTALDALTLAYESKDVFAYIRGAMSSSHDYKEMSVVPEDSDEMRNLRGSYWVVGKRVVEHNDFFQRAWKLQPRVMAVFGEEVEAIFNRLQNARAMVQVASRTLAFDMPVEVKGESRDDRLLRIQLRNDLWGTGDGKDRVAVELRLFRDEITRLCRPVVEHGFDRKG